MPKDSIEVTLSVPFLVTVSGVYRGAIEEGERISLGSLEELGEVVEWVPNGDGEAVSVEEVSVGAE